MRESLSRWLLGNPLPTREEAYQRLSKVKALAVFSSDALSSVAYAPEEILLALLVGGAVMLEFSLPIALCIVVLMGIVATSYYQTIHGYPSGGGAYIVAHQNLGFLPGLTAAAALLIDYVLTVAVSISAGVTAIVSAVPSLLDVKVPFALLTIALITWANLRGVRESGTIFSIPTYAFVTILLLLLIVGAIRLLSGSLVPETPSSMPALTEGAQSLAFFVVLRAFASGTTALTGVEAISNGIPAFEKPEATNAGKTLIAMALLLATMFLGVTFLADILGVVPHGTETVMSKIGRSVFGEGVLYLALQAATALILFLAANTSYADFPRLSAILASERCLPRQLASRGDRLVYSNGILSLAFLASVLVLIFGGSPHRLIPLYAVGVFLSFSLSQAGMVLHWRKMRGRAWGLKAAINGVGAVATGLALIVITASKLLHGAWIIVLAMPVSVMVLRAIRGHYKNVAEQLTLKYMQPEKWHGLATKKRYKVMVPISGMHRGTLAALQFARSLSKDVRAVVVDVEPNVTKRIEELWPRWGGDVPLVVLESPYRSTVRPLLHYLNEVDRQDPKRGLAVVVLPEFIPAKWWHTLLHNQTAKLIKRVLLYRRELAGTNRVLIDVPYHLEQ
jgi:amino acid transporter